MSNFFLKLIITLMLRLAGQGHILASRSIFGAKRTTYPNHENQTTTVKSIFQASVR